MEIDKDDNCGGKYERTDAEGGPQKTSSVPSFRLVREGNQTGWIERRVLRPGYQSV